MLASRKVLSLQRLCVATVVQAIRSLSILHPACTIWINELASMPFNVRQSLLAALWIANEQPNQQPIQPTVLLDVTLALVTNFVDNFNLDWTKSFRVTLQERSAIFEKKATRHLLERLSSSSKNSLESLSLHGCLTWTTQPPAILNQILVFSNLKHLRIEDLLLGEAEFQIMCANFKLLRSLDVNISYSVSPETILNCVAGLAYLEEFKFIVKHKNRRHNLIDHQNRLVLIMMYNFPRLRVVGRREEYRWFHFRTLCHSLGDRAVTFPQESSRLEDLVLLRPITTQQAQWHSHHATSLEVQLDLEEERWKPLQLLTNISRLMLAGYCSENTLVGMLQVYGPKLEELFSTSHFFLPCSLQKVFDHCPNLKKIGLNERLVSLSPSVEEVVTHLSMAHPLDDVNLLHAAPNLKRIKVTLWCLTVGNIRNNGHVLLQLPEVVPSLEALKVCTGECSNLIDQLLYEILENIVQRAPSLRVVEMEPRRPHFHFQFQGDRGNI